MAELTGKDLEKKIFAILRANGHFKVDEILEHFSPDQMPSREEVENVLKQHVGTFVLFDPEKEGYRIRHVFGPRPQVVPPSQAWRFGLLAGHPTIQALTIPDEYTNLDVANMVQLDQGDRGICVGCSGANITKLVRIKILKTATPPDEIKGVVRGITTKDGVVVDSLPKDTVSAEGVYQGSRTLITPPVPVEGSYITNAADYLVRFGVVPEFLWPTSKSSRMVYKSPPMGNEDLVQAELPRHKADGWAIIEDKSGDPTTQVQQAILTYGACWMAMPVYDNYTQAENNGGDFPDESAQIIGYHAVALVGWYNDSRGNRRWKFLNHWLGFTPLINTISDNFLRTEYRTGEIQLITLIDASAVAFLSDNAAILTVESNLDGTLTVQNIDAGSQPEIHEIKKGEPHEVSCLVGKTYLLSMKAVDGSTQEKTVTVDKPSGISVEFTFIVTYNLTVTSDTPNVKVTMTTQSSGATQVFTAPFSKLCEIYETYTLDATTQYGADKKSQTVYQTEAVDIRINFSFSIWERLFEALFAFFKRIFGR